MTILHSAPASLLAVILLAGTAVADDQPVQIKRCDTFCALWRTLSGNAQVSFDGPIPSEVRHDPPAPRAEDGAYAPRPDELVAVHGEVIRKTAAERAAEKRQLAEIMTMPTDAPPILAKRAADRTRPKSQ